MCDVDAHNGLTHFLVLAVLEPAFFLEASVQPGGLLSVSADTSYGGAGQSLLAMPPGQLIPERPTVHNDPAALQILAGHADVVAAVAVTPDGTRAVTAGRAITARVWGLAGGKELHTLRGQIRE